MATADQFDEFSNSLRDDMETRIAAAVAAEREAIRLLVSQMLHDGEYSLNEIEAAIRARGGQS